MMQRDGYDMMTDAALKAWGLGSLKRELAKYEAEEDAPTILRRRYDNLVGCVGASKRLWAGI